MGKAIRAAIVIAGAAFAFGATTDAGAAQQVAPANGTLACSVPAGDTYDFKTFVTSCVENGVNTGIRFEVIVPATGEWACTVPPGFTFTQMISVDDCSGRPDHAVPQYLLQAL
jgi:hypothetical protein